jgi:membrane protein
VFAYFETTLGWRELVTRTYKEMNEDDALGLSAQLAYYFFLALFPAILCVIAIASYFPLQNFTDEIVNSLSRFAPAEMVQLIREQMMRIAQGNDGGILSIGLLGALWSSSAAMVSIIDAMNRAYDIEESRPWWKVRLMAILLTIGLAVFIVTSFALVLVGPSIADWLAAHFGFGPLFVWTWKILQWPFAFALVVTGIGLIYYYAPDAEQEWVWITPGSLVATVLWLVGSLGFRVYVAQAGYASTYGAIAGVILLLLWFYLSGFVIVLGAEVSAEIEHASPWGKAPGEKIPGEKKKLGLAASRAFKKLQEQMAARPAPPPPEVIRPAAAYEAQPSFVERLGSYVLFLLRWRNRQVS